LSDWVSDFTEYTTWNVAFTDFVMPPDGWEADGVSVSIRGGPDDPETLNIGVDEIPRSEPETTDTIIAPDLEMHLKSPPSNRREQVPFRPARISATQIHELLECQRRYQYQHVQEISSSRLQVTSTDPIDVEPTEKSIPSGLNPDRWGDIVHEAFERRLEDESSLEAYLQQFTDPIQEAVAEVVGDAHLHTTEFREAIDSPDQAYAEFTVSTTLAFDGSPLRIDGDIDLLYQRNGSWYLVDYKTAVRPENEYEEQRYERQLQTYTWLLEREYGITVQEASLIYIDLDTDPQCRSDPLPGAVETGGFEEELRDRISGLEISSSRGLTAEPVEHRCSACPYSASRGGPCENE
jgi:ATP-dependent helicase/nuclease subunit A